MDFVKIEFPLKAKYKREENRVYFLDDFKDGEEIEFAHFHSKPSVKGDGCAIYKKLRKVFLQSCKRKRFRVLIKKINIGISTLYK